MRKTKLSVVTTTAFKKDYKLAIKRGLNIRLLEDIVAALAMGEPLPEKNKDHVLTGNWVGYRECPYPSRLAACLPNRRRCIGADFSPHRYAQ